MKSVHILAGTFLSAAALASQAAEPPAPSAVTRGKTVFQMYCTACHGRDGKAQIDLIANATNLTAPGDFKFGTDEAAIFTTISNGAGNMPAFASTVSDEDRRHLVSFIKSLWPRSGE